MHDAVIIGGGHNGLAAAATLAAKGWSVAVFERNSNLGGAVQTRELTLPGFRHDLGAMNLSLFAGSEFHRRHGPALARHGLEFVPASDCFASVFDDGRWLGVSTDADRTTDRIAAFSEADGRSWCRLLDQFTTDAPHLLSLLGTPMTPLSLARNGFATWRRRGFAFVQEQIRFLLSSPRAFLDENFEHDQVKATFAAWGMHLDFPPDQAGGALFPYLESLANQVFGMVIGKGGADTMITALSGMIKEAGGDIHCNAEVAEILTDRGRATGIRLADGSTVTARRAVIANVAPAALAGGLLPAGSGNDRYDKGLRRYRHAPGSMMIHLALDALPDWSAGPELKRFAYIHVAPSLKVMNDAYTQAAAGLLPAEPVLVVGQPTALDPSRAPEGKHVLWIQLRMVPAQILGDAAGRIDTRDWSEAKGLMAERALDLIARHAPDVRARILGQAVFSPLDLERENPNLVGGDQLCGSHHLAQNFLFRPVAGWSDWRTPVKGLYMVGAATWPGAGVGAGSGTLLADRLTR